MHIGFYSLFARASICMRACARGRRRVTINNARRERAPRGFPILKRTISRETTSARSRLKSDSGTCEIVPPFANAKVGIASLPSGPGRCHNVHTIQVLTRRVYMYASELNINWYRRATLLKSIIRCTIYFMTRAASSPIPNVDAPRSCAIFPPRVIPTAPAVVV